MLEVIQIYTYILIYTRSILYLFIIEPTGASPPTTIKTTSTPSPLPTTTQLASTIPPTTMSEKATKSPSPTTTLKITESEPSVSTPTVAVNASTEIKTTLTTETDYSVTQIISSTTTAKGTIKNF